MTRYVVRRGDTLSLIAERFGTTVDAIVKANDIEDPDLIYVGQVLIINASDDEVSPRPPEHPNWPPGNQPQPDPPTPSPPRPPRRPVVTRTFNGMEFTLTLNKRVYRMGERIVIRLKKKNILRVPLTLTYRTSQRVDFRVTRDDKFIWQWSQGRFFTNAVSTERYQPGEEKVYREVWNQRADSNIVRPGNYRITAWNLATPGVRLSLDFRIIPEKHE